MLVITSFLYDRCISSFRPAFVSLRQEDRNIWQATGCGLEVRLALRIVILRYKAGGLGGGRWYFGRFYVSGACCSSADDAQILAHAM